MYSWISWHLGQSLNGLLYWCQKYPIRVEFLVVSHSLFHHWRNGCCVSWFPFFWIDRVGECRKNLAMPPYLLGIAWSGWNETLSIRSAGLWHRSDIGSPVTSVILGLLVFAVHHGTLSLEGNAVWTVCMGFLTMYLLLCFRAWLSNIRAWRNLDSHPAYLLLSSTDCLSLLFTRLHCLCSHNALMWQTFPVSNSFAINVSGTVLLSSDCL